MLGLNSPNEKGTKHVGWITRKKTGHDVAVARDSGKPLARSEDLIVETVGDEVLVYDSRVDRAHCLSPEAARVWELCNGEHRSDDLAASAGLERDRVESALAELALCDLLEAAPVASGHTRRELTVWTAKATATAAAVPMIISVAAPTPAQAATLTFCLTFSDNDCGGANGCSGQPGCCCCTPPIKPPYPAGWPCATNCGPPTNCPECKTCVTCETQGLCQSTYGHNGNGCGNPGESNSSSGAGAS